MGWVGVENMQLSGLPFSQGGLNQTEVRDLVKAGLGARHPGLGPRRPDHVSPSELRFQVLVARRRLQAHYHVPVLWFCYPSGHYDAAVIAMVKAAGFRGATTVVARVGEPDRGSLHGCRGCACSTARALRRCSARSPGSAPTRRPGPSYS